MMKMLAWTEERKAQFCEYYAAGLSHSEIARRLGGTTKNACVSLAHRLSLPARRPARRAPVARVAPALPPPRPAPAKKAKRHRPRPIPPPPAKVVTDKGLIIWDLDHTHCRWPLAGEGVAMRYCAQPRDEGSSYCPTHLELSWAPHRRASASARQWR